MNISKRVAAILATAVAALGLTIGGLTIQGGDTTNQAGTIISRP
ncbi:hypothetical protein [Streptomyces sp. R35]|uniref:Uncharacterized protein n=1 Tax=Streptomyces sp. R35 TaxID=3238630 RepID=A0AB39S152_9ACTN